MTLIEELIAESGERWAKVKDRTSKSQDNSVFVCTQPLKGWRAWIGEDGKWTFESRWVVRS